MPAAPVKKRGQQGAPLNPVRARLYRLTVPVTAQEKRAIERLARYNGLEGRGAGSPLVRRYIVQYLMRDFRELVEQGKLSA